MALEIIFYVFSVVAIIGALLVVTSANPVRAVLSKVLTFVAAAGVWMSMQAEYLSLLLIVVYVGAVLVLFLFVIMMLDIKEEEKRASYVSYWIISALALVLFLALLIYGIYMAFHNQYTSLETLSATHSSIEALGKSMYEGFIYPFELAAYVLLAAMIAAITLAFRGKRRGNKSISPSKQIQVNAKDRLVMLKDLNPSQINSKRGE
ncbi:NADH-quinone oxidoreductase subunit J [Thiotrichales bacterium 19S11-10]|nr:NADH-quinone oxidoreductase subunit J [Thiotrichales bacterium 19S11-10]MCF6806975.1 NADH-quinone oxidoreductase subunit J [Thiotrichales bacterium 19S9-11]MCF6810944.1 NADH-quinone oxidoreductase subunit J [Thiotrichales bacterium 19S9-12]